MFGYYSIKCCLPKVTSLLGAFLLLLSQGLALDCQHCTRTRIQCFNLGLIPRNFPKTITLINLSRNNISRLFSTDLRGFNRLSALFLDNTGLVYVDPGAFFDLGNLHYLYLNHNQIQRFDPETFKGLSKLHYLYLQHNQISSIPGGLFSNLTAIRYLHLEQNHLGILGSEAFANLPNLRTLHLGNNRISWISKFSFGQLARLQFLYLQGNHLTQIPSHTFGGLKHIKRLALSENPIDQIHPFAFSGLENLEFLYLDNAKITTIAQNGFASLNNLKHLALNNNYIIHINSGSFKLLRLGYLQLSHNNITTIDSNAFVGMAATLKILHLANNHLSSLRADVLRPLASLAHLLVSGNPWECNCQLLDLCGWLLSSSLIVNIRCQSPIELRGKPLQNINVKELARCNKTLAPLTLDAKERGSTTNIVMTSVKPDAQSVAFKVKGRPVTLHEFGNENKRTEKLTSVLPVQTPIEYTSVNSSIFTGPDNAPMSIKPLYICEQRLAKRNRAFDILLAFFILACTAIIFLIYKMLQLQQKLRRAEAEGDNDLEFYSIYPYARYQVTDPVRELPPEPAAHPHLDQARFIKMNDSDNGSQVIFFEHSVL